jgi:hypothetical protein
MKLFLDDYRMPADCTQYMYQRIGNLNPVYLQEWIIVKNYEQFVQCVKDNYGSITHVSFDHDLADVHYSQEYNDMPELYDTCQEKTGLHCAIWLKQFYKENNVELPIIFVHSMNPVGTQNIIETFKYK